MKVLVTGSSGLVGSEAVKFFAEKGFKMFGIDNNMRKYFFGEDGDTSWNKDLLKKQIPDFKHFDIDIRDKKAVEKIFTENKFDLIIHAAAQPSHDWAAREPFTDFEINANGTLVLLENFRKYCPEAVFIFVSTNKVYGDLPNTFKMDELEKRYELDSSCKYAKEGFDETLSIDQSTHSLFGASKIAADILTQEYGRYFNLNTGVFRGGCLTGPAHSGAELHGFLSYLVKCISIGKKYYIYGYEGKQVRDNIHSYDLINAFYHFFMKPRKGEVYNLGGSRHSNISMIEAIEKIEKILGKKAIYEYKNENRKGDHIWYISDVSKFKKHFPNWTYKHNIDTMLNEMCSSTKKMYERILITGGAGFVGSNLAIKFKERYPNVDITVMDNLKRRGSELNLPRLKESGVEFIHGDIRNKEDFKEMPNFDLMIECSAEPSALKGINSDTNYLINTNLIGSINCFEAAKKNKSEIIFISTSRVYSINKINSLNFQEEESRFSLKKEQNIKGISEKGISEDFPIDSFRTLYGATKLCSEIILHEYMNYLGIKGIINRCGVITGPWQMGKIDQGVFVLWVAKHIFGGELSYMGFGGKGKQVRDFIHIDDLFELIDLQINDFDKFNGETYNVGGSIENSFSLQELTKICEEITGNKIKIDSVHENRPGDIIFYVTDYSKINKICGWKPKKTIRDTVSDITNWINENKEDLKNILEK